MFNEFPYTNYEKINLDWLLDLGNKLKADAESGAFDGERGPGIFGITTIYSENNQYYAINPGGVTVGDFILGFSAAAGVNILYIMKVTSVTGNYVNGTSIIRITGPQGIQGIQGNTGPQGEVSLNQLNEEISKYLTLDIYKTTNIPANSDLNDFITIGNYRIASIAIATSISNTPVNVGGRLSVLQINAASNYLQIYFTSNGRVFYRVTESGTWLGWQEVANVASINSINTELNTINSELSTIKSNYFSLPITEVSSIPANSNLNNYTTPGNFRITSVSNANSISNIPLKYGGRLTVSILYTAGSILQVYHTSTNRVFIRTKSSNTWTTWSELVNNSQLKKVTSFESNLYECSRTYYDYSKFNYFTYGAAGAFHYGSDGVQKQLNCSTHTALVVGGIPLYQSRYIDPDKPNKYFSAGYGFNFYSYARKLVKEGNSAEIAYLGEHANDMPDELVKYGYYQHSWLQAQALNRWGLTFDIMNNGAIDVSKLQVGDIVYYGVSTPPSVTNPEERILNGYYITHCNVVTEINNNGVRLALDAGVMPMLNLDISNFVPGRGYEYAIAARVPLTHY